MIDKRNTEEHLKERLKVKTVKQMFQRDMVKEFGLSPFNAKGIFNLMKEAYLPQIFGKEMPVNIGQARILAVSQQEPPGKALNDCQMVPVILTVTNPEEDEEVRVKYGQAQYRRTKILRMLEEACEQGAYLTQEDMAGIMNISIRTIKRDVSALRKDSYYVPLRGQQKDIGPTLSHKSQAVERYIRKEPVSKIATCIKHSPEAVVRYIKSFARVIVARERGLNIEETSFMLGLSMCI
jgi:NADH:ubiquinone oxidoreductase subunit E